MNTIVRKHYPVERLPADLREGLPAGADVTVMVELDEAPGGRLDISRLVGTGKNVHGNDEEVIAHLREGREGR
ncbi:MAG: hypothetical protein ACTHOR_17950 [Devosia sp.]|jgi:hypothetical protein